MNGTRNILIRPIILAALLPLPASAMEPAIEKPAGKAVTAHVERITDAELRVLQNAKPVSKTIAPVAVKRSYDIVEMSDFIVFDGSSTLVPKGAILNVPAGYRRNIVPKPSGKLLLWNEFLSKNYARVAPFEITVEEAAGHKAIDPKRLEAAMRAGAVTVAVIHGCPTSVTRPAASAKASTPAAAATVIH